MLKFTETALNSFNYCQKLEFKRKAIDIAGKLLSRKKDKKFIYDQGVDKGQTIPIFLDALWDVCNRPIRQEPMFIENIITLTNDVSNVSNAIDWIGLDRAMILSASKPQYDDSWFPMDITNYLLSSAANYDSKLGLALGDIFSGIKSDRSVLLKNPRNYYKDLANNILQDNILINDITSSEYPFTIECIDLPSINREHALFLHFKRKQPVPNE